MTVWLHVCCADCLIRFLVGIGYNLPESCWSFVKNYQQYDKKNFDDVNYNLVYLNPNIYPKAEYQARLAAVKKIAQLLKFNLYIVDYTPQDYFSLPAAASQLQGKIVTDRRRRCLQCQQWRLQAMLDYVATVTLNQSGFFSTTMLASQYLDNAQIHQIGQNLSKERAVRFWASEFINDPHSLRTAGYYKQNYCGCLFSLIDKTRAKYALNMV